MRRTSLPLGLWTQTKLTMLLLTLILRLGHRGHLKHTKDEFNLADFELEKKD